MAHHVEPTLTNLDSLERAGEADFARGAGSGPFGVKCCHYTTYGIWRSHSDGSNPNWVGSPAIRFGSPPTPVTPAESRARQTEVRAASRRFHPAHATLGAARTEYRSARAELAGARSRLREAGAQLRRRRAQCHMRHPQSRRARRQLAATHRKRWQAVSILRAARIELAASRARLRRARTERRRARTECCRVRTELRGTHPNSGMTHSNPSSTHPEPRERHSDLGSTRRELGSEFRGLPVSWRELAERRPAFAWIRAVLVRTHDRRGVVDPVFDSPAGVLPSRPRIGTPHTHFPFIRRYVWHVFPQRSPTSPRSRWS